MDKSRYKGDSIHTYTVAYIDINGAKLKEPIIYALIKSGGEDVLFIKWTR